MLGMVNILTFRDGAQKIIRTSTLRKLYNRHIFFTKPDLYNFPMTNMLGMVSKIWRQCIKNRLNLDFVQAL